MSNGNGVQLLSEIKAIGRRYTRLRKGYLWMKFAPRAIATERAARKKRDRDWLPELEEAGRIKNLGTYDRDPELSNDLQPYEGRNFLGYPAAGWIKRAGTPVGWCFGQTLRLTEDDALPFFQSATDVEINLPLVFETYRPEVVVDFGTAFGASALLYYDLIRKYSAQPQVMSVDINDVLQGDFRDIHLRNETTRKVSLWVEGSLEVRTTEKVRSFVESAQDRRVLLSFDDDHDAEHVFEELRTYGPMLRSRDVIVVHDTWNQGLRGSPFSPLLAVLRFLRTSDEFELDRSLLERVALPCSFVHGALVKK